MPQLAHQRRRAETVPHHVAHRDAEAPVAELERVVPVAADLRATGPVASGEGHAVQIRQPVGQETALQRLDGAELLLVGARVGDREAGAIRHQDQQALLVRGPAARRAQAELDDTGELAADRERRGQDGVRLLGRQRPVESLGEVHERDRPPLVHDLGERPGEVDAIGRAVRLEAARSSDHELERVLGVAQQDAREIGVEGLAQALDEQLEHVAQREVLERRLGHALQLRERLRHRLGLCARGALDRGAAAVGHVEHLPDQVQRALVGVDGERHAHERVAQLAVAAGEADLRLVRALALLHEPRHGLLLAGPVLRVRDLDRRPREQLPRARGRPCRRAPG